MIGMVIVITMAIVHLFSYKLRSLANNRKLRNLSNTTREAFGVIMKP